MNSIKSAATAFALIAFAGAGFAQTASADDMKMKMSSADMKKMDGCMAMSHDMMMKDKSCMSMMKKMKMTDEDMQMMMSCKGMSKDMMMKDEKCMSMMKMHPDMMKMPMAK